MSSIGRNLTRLAVAASAVAAMGVAVPSTPAAAASATVCGTGYEFNDAKALPSATNRKATLFFYTKGTSACAILDNNTDGAKYMDLQMYPGDTKSAGERDHGNFSEYAGPVHSSTLARGGRCVTITALMKNTSSSTSNLVNWKGGYVFAVDNNDSECA